jgi:hypothetical protein
VEGHWILEPAWVPRRGRAAARTVFFVVPLLVPASWLLSTIVLVLAALGVPIRGVNGPLEPTGAVVIVALVVPVCALLLAWVMWGLVEEELPDLLDTPWILISTVGGATVTGVTRRGRLRSARGLVTEAEGAPTEGVAISAAEAHAAGRSSLAEAMSGNDADAIVLAAFAGMIDRGELVVLRGRTTRWRRDAKGREEIATIDEAAWVACFGPSADEAGHTRGDPVEAAITRAVRGAMPPAPLEVTRRRTGAGYREAAPVEADSRRWVPAQHLCHAAYRAAIGLPADAPLESPGVAAAVAARLRPWMEREAAFSAWVLERCKALRDD